jgi:hypothetical protein
MPYYVHVAFQKGGTQRIYGPYDTVAEAQEFGTPFAQEGLDVEVNTDVLICDFCSSTEIYCGYPAEDFVITGKDMIGGGWGSRGGWCACEICYNLIEAGDRAGLISRSVNQFFQKNKEIPDTPRSRQVVIRHLVQLHSMFFISSFGQVPVKGAKSDPPVK